MEGGRWDVECEYLADEALMGAHAELSRHGVLARSKYARAR